MTEDLRKEISKILESGDFRNPGIKKLAKTDFLEFAKELQDSIESGELKKGYDQYRKEAELGKSETSKALKKIESLKNKTKNLLKARDLKISDLTSDVKDLNSELSQLLQEYGHLKSLFRRLQITFYILIIITILLHWL
jgi:chromosome segregation ATPase